MTIGDIKNILEAEMISAIELEKKEIHTPIISDIKRKNNAYQYDET